MILQEIIARITNLYEKGVPSRNSRLSPRHVYNKILTVRSKLIIQDLNKKQKVSQWNYQTLPCVELIVAPNNECPCLPPFGCEILRSKYPLPRPITGLSSHIIQSVSTLDGSVLFSEITWNEKKYKSSSKFTANKPDYYLRNNYLYLTHKNGLRIATITGLFDDPIDLLNFPSYCKEDCLDCTDCDSILDKDFPLDNSMIDTLVEISIQELIAQFSQMPEDSSTNSADTRTENNK